ncbi:hypothetical protein P4V41_20670 [Fictibacillus nanhaiensis]|uniref:hypothetical protein n=1 Tax=Fictibacillus nanhaiensis TaxID=742169 RepID=UPI002E2274D8|nr:hypothetical protein [Fictibacillus nanhaiensis]
MPKNPKILNGRYIQSKEEKEEILQRVKVKTEFILLFKELQKEVPAKLEDLELSRAYIYDIAIGNELGTGKHYTIQFSNLLQITYFAGIKGNQIIENIFGRVLTPEHKFIKVFEVNKGEVKPISTDKNEGQLDLEFKETGINNSEFVPLSSQNLITALAWSDTGCLEDEDNNRDYNHCGSGCGDGLSEGGGPVINNIDNCCRAHDRCWRNYGKWDHCCDKNIVNCAAKYEDEDNATQNQIWWAFSASAALC